MKFRIFAPLLSLLAASTGWSAITAPPLAEAEPKPGPGLTLTFTTPEGKADTRHARLVALYVPAGQAPTPFLNTGGFTAKWEGEIQSPLRGNYTLSADVRGTFKLTVNGAQVLDETTARRGKAVALNKGANTFVAELTRPADGDAWLRLRWASRDFPAEPISPESFTHNSADLALRTGERIRAGRLLFAQLRCNACHDGGAALPPRGEGMPELAQDAPVLGELGAQFHPAWLAHWINDPHAMRPHSLMPKVFQAKAGEVVAQEAADLAAYFASLGKPPTEGPNESLAAEGGAMFANLGCIACHSTPDAEGQDARNRVPLTHVKAKWHAPALTTWLQDPSQFYRWNRMPHFRLSPEEAQKVTAYLLTTAKQEFPEPQAGDASRGGTLLATSGCLNCHAGMPPQTTPKLEATVAAGWTKGCLATDAAGRGKAPDFALTAEQRDSLLAFAASGFDSLKQDSPIEFAERQVKNLNCQACHALDGQPSTWSQLEEEMAPLQAAAPLEEGEGLPHFGTSLPPLTLMGDKLKPDWMGQFIAGHGDKPRPWLVGRMPGFATPATLLAHGLSHAHGLPLKETVKPNEEAIPIGETLLGENGGFNCTTCHGVGENPATAPFEAPGTNLALSAKRLRHDYFTRWLYSPLRIDPETKMPRFADEEGNTPLTDHYEGKASEQFEAIWQYLQSVSK